MPENGNLVCDSHLVKKKRLVTKPFNFDSGTSARSIFPEMFDQDLKLSVAMTLLELPFVMPEMTHYFLVQ